jgi:hypothetical protein
MTFQKTPVGPSEDFERIRNLPIRHEGCYPPNLAEEMSQLLRVPGGTETLLETQAKALYDLGTYGKGFFPIRVGGGKTYVTFLAPRMLGAKRPVLLLPAKLVQKTEREMHHAAQHWRIAKHLRIVSYEKLGRVSGAALLDLIKPDMIIADESFKIKNPRAAVTRRVGRYVTANPTTVFVPLSGTIMKDSVLNFAHLMWWAMGDTSVLPRYEATLQEWADALDEGVNPLARRSPGILLDLYTGAFDDNGSDGDDNSARARRVFQGRAKATAGIVMSDARDAYGGSLQINALEYTPNEATEKNFRTLRETMCRPDGWALTEAMQAWAVARQLALGLHYEWVPPAPQEWLNARKAWAQYVRDFLGSPRSKAMEIDSEFQTLNAVLAGKLDDTYGVLAEWRRMRPTFTPHPVPVWHDRTALYVCGEWLKNHPRGIVWVEHKFFGAELSRLSGKPYFGPKGLDPQGNFIEDAHGPIIASVAANAEGRNLQHKWSEALVTAPAADSERWEQLLGRLHRYGQPEDCVSVEALVGCREHAESIPRALSSSDVKMDLLGFTQKLRVADITWPARTDNRPGFRWA